MSREILIVDSSCTDRLLADGDLSIGRHVLRSCATVEEAWTALDDHLPDLILVGSGLGQPGAAFCRELKKWHGTMHLPIIALGPADGDRARMDLLRAGADEVLARPVDPSLLMARIRALLRGADEVADLDEAVPATGLAEEAEPFFSRGRVCLVTGRDGTLPDSLALVKRRHAVSVCPEDISLASDPPDLIVLDAAGGATDFTDAIRNAADGLSLTSAALFRQIAELRSHGASRHVSVLALIPPEATNLAIMALDLGANDVVTSTIGPEELAWRAEGLIRRKRAQERRRDEVRDGLRAAVRDPLTGLYNRRYALPALDLQAANAGPLAVIMVDIDNFKAINDRYGHPAGDQVLTAVATLLERSIGQSGLVARLGGEEFLAVAEATGPAGAERMAESLRLAVEAAPIALDGPDGPATITIDVTISVGVALGRGEARGMDLLDRADAELLRAKREGKNRTCGPERGFAALAKGVRRGAFGRRTPQAGVA